MPSCLRLLVHFMRLAASRTFCTAGSNRPIRMAMIAITTNNSIKVKARRWFMKRSRRADSKVKTRDARGRLDAARRSADGPLPWQRADRPGRFVQRGKEAPGAVRAQASRRRGGGTARGEAKGEATASWP